MTRCALGEITLVPRHLELPFTRGTLEPLGLAEPGAFTAGRAHAVRVAEGNAATGLGRADHRPLGVRAVDDLDHRLEDALRLSPHVDHGLELTLLEDPVPHPAPQPHADVVAQPRPPRPHAERATCHRDAPVADFEAVKSTTRDVRSEERR